MEHPASGPAAAFSPILTAIQDAPRIAREAQIRAYVTLLKQHDWSFEQSDDGSAYRRGRAERAGLIALQREIDPKWEVWNHHCPDDQRVEPSAAPVAEFTHATDAQPWRLPA